MFAILLAVIVFCSWDHGYGAHPTCSPQPTFPVETNHPLATFNSILRFVILSSWRSFISGSLGLGGVGVSRRKFFTTDYTDCTDFLLLLRLVYFQTSEVYQSATRWRNLGFGRYYDQQNLCQDLGGLSCLSSNR